MTQSSSDRSVRPFDKLRAGTTRELELAEDGKAEAGNYQGQQKTGEWAESVFVARAAENGLEISKPIGESGRFDCVVGGPGKFVAVQVKCTIAKLQNRERVYL